MFTNDKVIATGFFQNEVLRFGLFCGLMNLCFTGVGASYADILKNAPIEPKNGS